MSEKDLIDISTREDFKEITAKGGRVKSARKTAAAKIRAFKFMKPETIEKRALELATSESASALEIMQMIQAIKKADLKDDLRIRLVDSLTKAHTAIHGSKSKNVNVNINVEKEMEDFSLKWKEYQKRKQKVVQL